jgi:mevalonate kinase
MKRVLVVAVAAVACLAIAACGGSDDKKLSKGELAKKANEICKTASKESSGINAPANITQDPVAAADYFGKLAPIFQKETDALAKLKPADEIKADWTQFVDRQKQANETLKIVRDKAKAKDRSGLQDLAKQARILTKLTAEANAVGATECTAV